jgi:hypothetical protein
LNKSARRSVLGELVDRRNFGGGIKAYSGTERNHTACDLSRGNAEVKSMTSRSRRYFENATYLERKGAGAEPVVGLYL